MRRREFITLVGGASASLSLAARAQQLAMPVVGYLATVARDAVPFQTVSFHRGLAEIGYTEGSNLVIEYRWGDDRVERLPALADDLVTRRVDVIAAFATASIRAAKAATGSVPIVFLTGDDPITAGLVDSLSRPSGNLTGVTFSTAALGAKRLELLRILIPKGDQIALLTDPNSPESVTQSNDLRNVAQTLGHSAFILNIGMEDEFETAFATMAQRRVDAFVVGGSPFFNARRDLIAALAMRNGIPGMYGSRNFTAAGGLISYGANIPAAYRQAGVYVGRILKGSKPADLPVLQPTQYDLVLNLRAARVLRLVVPDRLLALADEVIE
jgi:putative ABC transport system substrate-binding protein